MDTLRGKKDAHIGANERDDVSHGSWLDEESYMSGQESSVEDGNHFGECIDLQVCLLCAASLSVLSAPAVFVFFTPGGRNSISVYILSGDRPSRNFFESVGKDEATEMGLFAHVVICQGICRPYARASIFACLSARLPPRCSSRLSTTSLSHSSSLNALL